MTTKDQERKALEQIKNIVLGLGDDSYIGTAFEGCFEIAEENIENDFACSMKERAESAQREAARYASVLDSWKIKAKNLEDETQKQTEWLKNKDEEIGQLKRELDQKDAELHEEKVARGLTEVDRIKTDDEIKNLKAEIVKLKAKLYDLIVEEE